MLPISQSERDYLQLNTRRFYSRILCGGNEVSGVVRSWVVSKGSCGSGSFQPQSIFSNYADITIDHCTDSLKGRKIEIQIGVNATGSITWHTIATLYVKDAPTKGYRTNVECLGVISAKLGTKFYGSTYTTVSSLLGRLSEVAGVNIVLDSGLSDLTIPAVDLSDYYYREVLSFISGLYFGYVTEDSTGTIHIKSYRSTGGTLPVYLHRMSEEPDIYEKATVEGIQVITAEDKELITGNLQNCSLTNPLMTAEAFNRYCNNYVGYSYEAHSCDLTLGDFTLEAGDQISIQDRKGITHTLPCMSLRFNYDGGLRTTVSAPTLDSGEDFSREETAMQANTAYNAFVSGNFGSGEPEYISNVQRFAIEGDNISNGFGWTDNGEIYYLNFDLTAPDSPANTAGGGGTPFSSSGPSYASVSGEGQMGLAGIVPLGVQYVNGVMPLFYHNGSAYTGAGALAYSVGITIREDGSFTWTLYLQFTTTYVESTIGNIFTKSADGSYNVLSVDTTIPVRTFFLSNTVK